MLSATFLGIFFVPVFFVLVRGYFAPKPGADAAKTVEVH
jgi:multidrug efflux pump